MAPYKFGATHARQTREIGAVDETRTRDLHLGKVALYQLSYYRMVPWGGIEPPTRRFSVYCSTN